VFEISDLAKQYAPWSVSKAELAETCPKQFELKHLLKAPEESIATANKVGTVAHAVLEHRIGGADLKTSKALALEKSPLTSTELEDLRVLEDAMEEFVVKFDNFCRTFGVTEVLREKKWAITATGSPTDFKAADAYFRGVVDLCALTRDGMLAVIDHKSGTAKDIARFDKYKTQINSYAVMGLANMPNIAGVRGAIHFLQGPAALRIQWMDPSDAGRITKLLLPWLFHFVNKCAANLAVQPFVAKPSFRKFPCGFCAYRPSCTAHQELLRASEI
jgi:hypothetical protein